MNLAELKTAWNDYDRKLQGAHTINDTIVSSMIRARSVSRVSWIEKLYGISFLCNSLWIILGVVVIVTNPFGFIHEWQHIPVVVLIVSLAVLLLVSVKNYSQLKAVNISQNNLDSSLKGIIQAFDKPWKYLKWNIVAVLSSAFLFPVSFLPIHIQSLGLWPALILLVASMSVVALVCLISAKLGLFKERYGSKFKEDLRELIELKSMSSELMKDS